MSHPTLELSWGCDNLENENYPKNEDNLKMKMNPNMLNVYNLKNEDKVKSEDNLKKEHIHIN